MGHRQATLRHRLDEVSQAQLEPKIPAQAQNDDSEAEVSARKQMVQVLILAMANFSHSGANIAAARHRCSITVKLVMGRSGVDNSVIGPLAALSGFDAA